MTARQAPQVCDVSLATEYRKVLVALDRSGSAPFVFANALNVARAHGGHVLAFHCISYLPGSHELMASSGMGFYAPEAVYFPDSVAEETIEDITGWLKNWQGRADDCEISCEFEYRIGDPGREICEAAKRWGADLVVVGRHDRSGIAEMLLGSTSNYVMHHAQCSVLVVHMDDEDEEEEA